nr:hypothetical protein [Tanacetum cinerariifolium]
QSPRTSPSQATEGSSILVQQVLDKCSTLVLRVKGLEVKKLERLNKVKSSKLRRLKKVGTSQHTESSEDEENVLNQGRISVDIDEGIKLVDDQEKDAQEDIEVQEVVEVMNAAKLMTEVATTATSIHIPAAEPAIVAISAAKPAAKPKSAKDKGKGILVKDPKPMKKKDQIEMDAEYARKLQEEEESHAQPKDVQAKGIQYIRRYHGYKKKPQSESEAHKNMIAYLKNTEGFKMAFFKGKTYDQIRLIFQARFDANMRFLLKSKEEIEKEEEEIIKSINETPAQKAPKRRRLHDTHQLYTSFITLLKNFDREDLEDLWIIVKARFSTSKPTNFTNDNLLVTLKNMFEKTDAQDVIWRSQQTELGQAL